MKELVIVSGKGGTGKTSISAALASIAQHKIMVDCDVDAANFHLVIGAQIQQRAVFMAGFEPQVDPALCIQCGTCTNLCRFQAIQAGLIKTSLDCEGCGVCAFNCPQHAITMREKKAGEWFVSTTRFGQLVHAELGLAIENSGKLVSKVRYEAKKLAQEQKISLIITDGPPGIGCPAIAALSGATLALAVVEPSLPSIHDLQRLTTLVKHFNLPLAVCINKSTLHQGNVTQLIQWCGEQGIPIVGQLPYSDTFRQAVQTGQTVMELHDEPIKEQITELWKNVAQLLDISTVPHTENVLQRTLKRFW